MMDKPGDMLGTHTWLIMLEHYGVVVNIKGIWGWFGFRSHQGAG